MGMHLSVEVYDIFEDAFKGREKAKKVMSALEEVIVSSVHDTWYRTKEELKMEVFSHFATKSDLEQVRTELIGKFDALYEKTEKDKAELIGMMKQDKAELLGTMKQDKAELLGIINQNKEELLGKFDSLYVKTEKDKAELLGIINQNKQELLGIINQNKEELLGIINQNKEELLGIINQNKLELLSIINQNKEELSGKIEALYQKTEKDKAELLGIIKQTKEQLLGKFDTLYQKTEKDKAELLLKIEKIDKKFSMYFVVLLFAIIFLNQNALEFIVKVLGLVR